ncbi:MAG TPA: CDF family Co(II)/Ni(II) efflux transporter DmeF [Janthinobacterium sp.]|nr:CDF family Co(II)/Ni(II) efflux transporter DmeF [Janthinobacterium sp.]
MNNFDDTLLAREHEHVFLGAGHDKNERKTWAVIAICGVMMVAEIAGGSLFGSLALVADGLHMSTHAGAMLIAALAYTYARKHAGDRRFVFGTGKLGDLAGFSSAIILAMIALLIGYEAIVRLLAPVAIRFSEAIPIALIGLAVNIVSAWLLSGGDHGHSHGHGHGHSHATDHHAHHDDEIQSLQTASGLFALSIFEEGVAPVFRLRQQNGQAGLAASDISVTTVRADGARQAFAFSRLADCWQSNSAIPEPHAFQAIVTLPDGAYPLAFEEHGHEHGRADVDAHDYNMRAAYIHVIADTFVSVLAIVGLLLAMTFGWLWMDPLAGIAGALVIANWSYGLLRDTGKILIDLNPDDAMADKVRGALETGGDKLLDLHIWRLGPGHFGAVVSIVTAEQRRGPAYYHALLRRFKGLSHITVEVHAPLAA